MKLVNSDDQLLKTPSKPVGEDLLSENGRGLKPLASLLMQKIIEHNALGISACQLGIDLALFAIDVNGTIKICANPQIVAAAAEMEKAEEGCLSFPNLYLKVNRPNAIIARYHNENGQEVTEQLDGLVARAWLHEYDHTIGICFTNRVGKLSLDLAKRKSTKKNRRISK